MADGVNKKFRTLISRHFEGCGEKEAERKQEDLAIQGRYVEEIFGAEEE